jgi:hypothetical protein
MATATSSESVPPANESDFSAPTRIKRNTACVRCRDAKVSQGYFTLLVVGIRYD